jgi:hypothetical protein
VLTATRRTLLFIGIDRVVHRYPYRCVIVVDVFYSQVSRTFSSLFICICPPLSCLSRSSLVAGRRPTSGSVDGAGVTQRCHELFAIALCKSRDILTEPITSAREAPWSHLPLRTGFCMPSLLGGVAFLLGSRRRSSLGCRNRRCRESRRFAVAGIANHHQASFTIRVTSLIHVFVVSDSSSDSDADVYVMCHAKTPSIIVIPKAPLCADRSCLEPPASFRRPPNPQTKHQLTFSLVLIPCLADSLPSTLSRHVTRDSVSAPSRLASAAPHQKPLKRRISVEC